MDQPSPATGSGLRKPVPTQPCESCARPTAEHTLAFINGKMVCPSCAGAANDTSDTKRKRRYWAIGTVVVLLVAGIFWFVNANSAEEREIAISLARLRSASLSSNAEANLAPYLDGEATYNDLYAAAKAGGAANPEMSASGMWRSVVTTAIQGGTLVSVEGDRAVMRRKMNRQRGDVLVPFVVEYELRNTAGETWKVTRILNADEIYNQYDATNPNK